MATEPAAQIDLVWGIANIAQLIGRTERQTQMMLATGSLPAKQIGKRWVISRKRAESFFEGVAA